MPTKDVEKARAYRLKHYYKNKEQYYTRNVAKKELLKQYVNSAKDVPCTDCGVKYPPYVMDFDHLDAEHKEYNVSHMVNRGSLVKLKAEISKCEVVCSNCHRERTHKRRSSPT